jgi:hypothetical protein
MIATATPYSPLSAKVASARIASTKKAPGAVKTSTWAGFIAVLLKALSSWSA